MHAEVSRLCTTDTWRYGQVVDMAIHIFYKYTQYNQLQTSDAFRQDMQRVNLTYMSQRAVEARVAATRLHV
jgi:hypothetical protein